VGKYLVNNCWVFNASNDPDVTTTLFGGFDAHVKLHMGFPQQPTFYFDTNEVFLNRLYRGEMSADTGAVKASEADYVPMNEKLMEGAKHTRKLVTQRVARRRSSVSRPRRTTSP